MAAVVAPLKKRLKTGLPAPCVYNDLYSSYRVEWEARKRKFPPSIEVSSVCHFNMTSNNDGGGDSPDLLLVGMTNGSLSIFQQFGQPSQSEEDVLDQQVLAMGDVNDDESDEKADDDEESFGWRLAGSRQLCEGALTFVHVSSLPKEESVVVLAGGVHGLWWWNSLEDLLQCFKSRPNNAETKGKENLSRPKNQPVNHSKDISIATAEANDLDLFFSTPEHKLYHLRIPSLIIDVAKVTPSDWLQEMPMPDSDTSDHDAFEVTTLHLTGTRTMTVSTDDDDDSPAAASTLLIGTNQSKVYCWNVPNEAYSEPLDLSTCTTVHMEKASASAFGEDPSHTAKDEASIRVTAITSIQPDWWTIAGTKTFPNAAVRHRHQIKRPVNFLGTWHGPSKSRTQLVSKIPEKIQGLMACSLSNKLYSIGNLPVLTVWESPYQLNRLHRIKTNGKSSKAICSMKYDILAVAGVGSKVDLMQSTVRLQSLDLLQTLNSVDAAAGVEEMKK